MNTVLLLFVRNFIFLLVLFVTIAFLNVILHTFLSSWGIDYPFFKTLYKFLDPVVYWVDHRFGNGCYKANAHTGVPVDSPFALLLIVITLFTIFFISVVGTCVQIKSLNTSMIRLERYTLKLREVVRIVLAVIMFYYGIRKMFLTQMPQLSVDKYLTPLGSFTKTGFMWTFIGASKEFQIFLGISETIVAILLLFRKTSVLGLLIAFVITINICVMNFAYEVPARILACLVMLMIVFLLVPYVKMLYTFFLQGKPAKIEVYHGRIPNRRRYKVLNKVLPVVIMLFLVTDAYCVLSTSLNKHIKDTSSIYQVESFILGRDTIPSLYNKDKRWNFLIFKPNQMLTIIYTKGNRKDYTYKIDSVGNQLWLFNRTYNPNSVPVSTYKIKRSSDKSLELHSTDDSLHTKLQFMPISIFDFEIESNKSWIEKLPTYSVK